MVIAVDEPHPSAVENLEAEYGHEWEIWRELLPNGSHGDWIARRWPSAGTGAACKELRAATISALSTLLAGQPNDSSGEVTQ